MVSGELTRETLAEAMSLHAVAGRVGCKCGAWFDGTPATWNAEDYKRWRDRHPAEALWLLVETHVAERMGDAWDEGYKAAHGDVERDEEGLGFRVTPNPYRALRGDDR